jgi:oxygen-independent coproporphyrinogen-3 oxidase
LRPDRVAAFGYAHVPWMTRHQRLLDEKQLPDTAARWRQAEATSKRLIEHGYETIGLDHFARPDDPMALAARAGRLRRNFQGYTTDQSDTLIAFGPSAIGALPDAYVQNATDLRRWREAVSRGQLATCRGIVLDLDDLMRREIIERIMCDDTVDVAAIARRHGHAAPPFGPEQDRLLALAADELIALDGWTIALRPPGRPLRRAVASAFDRYLGQGEARHAKAV